MGRKRVDLDDMYMPEPNSGCWLWLGSTDGKKGYGRTNPRAHGERQAHRALYRLYNSEIPAGLVIDHKCRNPACVNPGHMEVVTQHENMMRGQYKDGLRLGASLGVIARKARTHCRKGHEWNEKNTARQKGAARKCRACHNERERERKKSAFSCAAAGGL